MTVNWELKAWTNDREGGTFAAVMACGDDGTGWAIDLHANLWKKEPYGRWEQIINEEESTKIDWDSYSDGVGE